MSVEILIVLVIALMVIPPEKLPEAARAIGKFLSEVKSVSNTALREVGEIVDEIPMRKASVANDNKSKSQEIVDLAQLLSSNEPPPRS